MTRWAMVGDPSPARGRKYGSQAHHRDPTNIVAIQFGDVLVDRIVQTYFAAQRSERDQCSLKHLAHGRYVEQRVRCDRPLAGLIGEAVVEELDVARDVYRGCEPAGIIGRHHRGEIFRHNVLNP